MSQPPSPEHPFRFFDNREKYLLFVSTTSEKQAIAARVGRELEHLRPRPPALRLFDAGMGDGTVLMRVLRHLHRLYPTVPFLVVGKEISLEDVRMSLEKLPDRFHEHPQMVAVVTNMYYFEATGLRPKSRGAAEPLNWHEIALEGDSAHAFDAQIQALQPLLAGGWQTRPSPKTGNPNYVRPSVLVLYRKDQEYVLDRIVPQPGGAENQYDLVVASQPYRARLPVATKVGYVLEPMVRCLAPGGRMIAIQSTGKDPGMEIIRRVWPEADPFRSPRRNLIAALKARVEEALPDLNYLAGEDASAEFRYHLHILPEELSSTIGSSTLLAAWNAAVYVAQIDDDRLVEALGGGAYLRATEAVLHEHGGLWFLDESFVVHREPG
jgi:hypothetical protein